MTVKRMDNVGIVVEDIDAAIEFFTELGLELDIERMIAVDGDAFLAHGFHSDAMGASILPLRLEMHAGLYVVHTLEGTARQRRKRCAAPHRVGAPPRLGLSSLLGMNGCLRPRAVPPGTALPVHAIQGPRPWIPRWTSRSREGWLMSARGGPGAPVGHTPVAGSQAALRVRPDRSKAARTVSPPSGSRVKSQYRAIASTRARP